MRLAARLLAMLVLLACGAWALDRAIVHRALALGGTCSGEHGVGLGKREFLEIEHGPEALAAMRADLAVPVHASAANRFQHPCTVWAEVPVPVIAAIHGPCLGAGLQLALGADLRLAAPSARLALMEARWGLIPDMGAARVLPRLMPADRALELMLTARTLDGAEAVALGLVTRLADAPLTEARALARALTARNPEAVRAIKALVASAWPGAEAALALEARLQAPILGSPNQIEAVMAEMQRRPPRFA